MEFILIIYLHKIGVQFCNETANAQVSRGNHKVLPRLGRVSSCSSKLLPYIDSKKYSIIGETNISFSLLVGCSFPTIHIWTASTRCQPPLRGAYMYLCMTTKAKGYNVLTESSTFLPQPSYFATISDVIWR